LKKLRYLACVVFVVFFFSMAGCGGTKVLKDPEPLLVTQALATASDQRLSVTLDWVIIRDGPGTWAKNVDWDEYLISARNRSGDSLQVTNIVLVDSIGTRIETGVNRKQLVKGSRKAKRRYKDEGLTVKAGAGTGSILIAGAAVAAGSVAVAMSGPILATTTAAGATAGAVGALIVAPVLVVGGVMRGVNNSRVNNQIELRQTLVPVELREEEEKGLNIFFPLTPSPRQVEITYSDSQGSYTLIIDTHVSLDGLHLVQATE
jgi:hypothetical protein